MRCLWIYKLSIVTESLGKYSIASHSKSLNKFGKETHSVPHLREVKGFLVAEWAISKNPQDSSCPLRAAESSSIHHICHPQHLPSWVVANILPILLPSKTLKVLLLVTPSASRCRVCHRQNCPWLARESRQILYGWPDTKLQVVWQSNGPKRSSSCSQTSSAVRY